MAITMKLSDDKFEKIKITKVSTNKVCTNVYYDSFSIGKVRFQNANYNEKTKIDCYMDFEELAILATDVASGRIIKKLEAGEKISFMTGSKSSKNYNGQPESRVLSFGISVKNDGPEVKKTIFFNMSRGKGKLSETGAIMPDGAPDLKIGVPMSVDKFRSMLIYTHDWVMAYLAGNVNQLVGMADADRKANANSNH